MEIEPDTKDWTWVLEERCPECGFDCRSPRREELASLVSAVGERWLDVLPSTTEPARRPEPQVWSPLEYACHVRDVCALSTYRVTLMLDEDVPLFANWDQDVTAVEERYASQDPITVNDDLGRRAREFADRLASVPDDAWDRAGRRSDGARFTVESFARYLLHDPIHHLTDVTGVRWSD